MEQCLKSQAAILMKGSEYQKLNYDRIGILLPKGSRSILNQVAAENGISTSQLVISAIEKQYNISLKKEK
jgi:hypothetical protein